MPAYRQAIAPVSGQAPVFDFSKWFIVGVLRISYSLSIIIVHCVLINFHILLRNFQATNLPILLALLLLLEPSQSLRRITMRLHTLLSFAKAQLSLEIIQPEAKNLRNMGRFITWKSLSM